MLPVVKLKMNATLREDREIRRIEFDPRNSRATGQQRGLPHRIADDSFLISIQRRSKLVGIYANPCQQADATRVLLLLD